MSRVKLTGNANSYVAKLITCYVVIVWLHSELKLSTFCKAIGALAATNATRYINLNFLTLVHAKQTQT
jgi:hypothetical protein